MSFKENVASLFINNTESTQFIRKIKPRSFNNGRTSYAIGFSEEIQFRILTSKTLQNDLKLIKNQKNQVFGQFRELQRIERSTTKGLDFQ